MNIVLLSPHFPEQQARYASALAQQGACVIGVGDHPPQGLSAEVQSALSDYFYVSDLHHYDELLRTCGQIIWKYGRLDRLDSMNEHWLATEAKLRSDFNITGIKQEDIPIIKEKSEMKRLFVEHGIPCARGLVPDSLQEALSFAKEVKYPVVLKPNIGVGAASTYRIHNDAELIPYFSNVPDCGWIIEEFIDGEICTFDGLANRSGEAVFFTSMVYSGGVMDIVNQDDHVYFYTLREIPPDLEALGQKLLKIFPVKERFFHFEFFRRPSTQELVALEVNLRPPGGPSVDMFNFAHDIDLYHEWSNIVLHDHFNAPIERKYFCCYVGRKFNKSYRYTHQEILNQFGSELLHHAHLPGVFQKAMGDYYYLFRTREEERTLEIARYIQALADV